MKKITILFVVAIVLSALGIGSRADHNAHPEIVRAMREHAQALKKDAAIYQRNRMNAHMGHIVEEAKSLRKAMASHSCLKTDMDAIQGAIADLQAATVNANSEKTALAVRRLSDLSDVVLTKYCKEDKSPLK